MPLDQETEDRINALLEREEPEKEEKKGLFERVDGLLEGPTAIADWPELPEAPDIRPGQQRAEAIPTWQPSYRGRPAAYRRQPSGTPLKDIIGIPEGMSTGQLALEAAKGIPRGLGRGLAGAPQAWAQIQKHFGPRMIMTRKGPQVAQSTGDKDLDQYLAWKIGEKIIGLTEEAFPQDPRVQGNIWFDLFPEGLGNTLSFVAGGATTKALKLPAWLGVTFLGSGMGGAGMYERAKAAGASEEDATKAAHWSFLYSGPLELLGVPLPALRMLSRLDRSSGGALHRAMQSIWAKALTGAGREAFQEAVQQGFDEKVAQKVFDDNQDLFKAVGEAGAVGGLVGFTFNLIAGLAGKKLGRYRSVSRNEFRKKSGTTVKQIPPAEQRAQIIQEQELEKAVTEEAARLLAQPQAQIEEMADARRLREEERPVSETHEPSRGEETRGDLVEQAPPEQPGRAPLAQEGGKPDWKTETLLIEEAKDSPDLLDRWFAERDVRDEQIAVDARKFWDRWRQIAPKNKQDAQQLSRAMMLYIEGNQEQQLGRWGDTLTNQQRETIELSKRLPPEARALADDMRELNRQAGYQFLDEGGIQNVHENYVARLYKAPPGKRQEVYTPKFATKTARQRQRKLESIIHGWSRGQELAVDNPIDAMVIARQQVSQVIVDKQLLATGQKMGLISDTQHEGYKRIKHPNFTAWKFSGETHYDKNAEPQKGDWVRPADRENLGRIVNVEDDAATVHFRNRKTGEEADVFFPLSELKGKVVFPRGKNFVINDDGVILERRPLYAEPWLAKRINRALGESALRGIRLIDEISRYNAQIKLTILMTAFFHHQAIMRSSMGGSMSANLAKSFQEGREAILNFTPQYQDLVRGGLRTGIVQDVQAWALEDQTALGRMIDKVAGARRAKAELLALRDQQTQFLFNTALPYLKVQAALLEYAHLLKKYESQLMAGTKRRHDLAKIAAEFANADFGQLHLGRLGRDPTLQHIFQLVALAPDWTESNIRTMIHAIHSSEQGKAAVYRAFWGRVLLRLGGATILFNLLLSMLDDESFLERYREAWEEGHLRWLDVDVTPFYRQLPDSLKGEKGDTKRKYFSLIGHFRDPLKFIVHTGPSIKHKGSVLSRFVSDYLTGSDWADRPFTTLPELSGVDEKGLYRTTREGEYETGEPKGGKLKGHLVAKERGSKGAVSWAQFPSWLIYEARQSLPIPVQCGIQWLQGELDGFDAITRSLGMMTATTHPYGDEEQTMLMIRRLGTPPAVGRRQTEGEELVRQQDIEAAREYLAKHDISLEDARELYKTYLIERFKKPETRRRYLRAFDRNAQF